MQTCIKKERPGSSLTVFYAKNFAIKTLPLFIISALYSSQSVAQQKFNPAFLAEDPTAVADLNYLLQGSDALPGKYRVDIYINDHFIATEDIDFEFRPQRDAPDHKLMPALTVEKLNTLGVNTDAFSSFSKFKGDSAPPFESIIPDAAAHFDFEQQKLYISIPQAAMKSGARGYISPERWDEGINAALLNYSFTGSNAWGKSSSNNAYLNVQSGVNVGPWRLRNYSTANHDKKGWDTSNISSYLQRTIISLKSQLTIGDSYTTGDVFDPIGFRGLQMASDDGMLPDSLRGYAPVIRGVAKGNARVEVRQNGYIIYQTYVSPGAFALTDLYPTTASGNLSVSVHENDGSVNVYSVPYSSVPILQREGRFKYALTAGKFRGYSGQSSPQFGQLDMSLGLPLNLTMYGGMLMSEKYRAVALGLGKNLGSLGAISADMTHAQSELIDGSRHQGQSLRFLYAKSLNDTGTNFQLLGYRYSTQGFYTLSDTANPVMVGRHIPEQIDATEKEIPDYIGRYDLHYNRKGKVQFNVSQPLGGAGSLYLSGSYETYWQTRATERLLQIGYNNVFRDISYSLSYNHNKNLWSDSTDRIISLTISVPLAKWLPGSRRSNNPLSSVGNSAYANYGSSLDNHGKNSHYTGINGTALEGSNLSYNVQQGYGNQGQSAFGYASLDYRGASAHANTGYSYSGDTRQLNYAVSGGIIAHEGGITLSQPLGDTNVLVSAPGAGAIDIENATGVKTDWRGYAVIPYANNYRENRIALDTRSLKEDLEVEDAVASVIPTRGALVRANFSPRNGKRVLMKLTYRGKPVPFGAVVSQADSASSIVGDNGQVYLSGMLPTGQLEAKWGAEKEQRCRVNYRLEMNSPAAVLRMSEVCQ